MLRLTKVYMLGIKKSGFCTLTIFDFMVCLYIGTEKTKTKGGEK